MSMPGCDNALLRCHQRFLAQAPFLGYIHLLLRHILVVPGKNGRILSSSQHMYCHAWYCKMGQHCRRVLIENLRAIAERKECAAALIAVV